MSFLNRIALLWDQTNKVRLGLLSSSLILFLALIILKNTGVLPLEAGDLGFFCGLFFLLALYRPRWAFLIFVSLLPLENITFIPPEWGFDLRPYQAAGALLILALAIRFTRGRLPFLLAPFIWADWLLGLVGFGGFIALVSAPDQIVSFKLAVIVISFWALYYLSRQYIRDGEDTRKILPFILGPGVLVALYALWQNIRFAQGLESFEVMPGRPNGTFTEADWLGMYLMLMISVVYALLYYFHQDKDSASAKLQITNYKLQISVQFLNFQTLKRSGLWGMLVLFYIVLILTVARSAWLGTVAATFVFLFLILTYSGLLFRQWQWKNMFIHGGSILTSAIIALGIVSVFNLTTFELDNRTQSVASGLQNITVSCVEPLILPERIPNMQTLDNYNCRHINLEEIETEKMAGRFVTTVARPDPNVTIRKNIYHTVLDTIREHPVLGIGWGSIGSILGTDERPARNATHSVAGGGVSLNASNIFLEVWLGAGLLGLIALVILLGKILFESATAWYMKTEKSERAIALFILVSGVGLIVFNLFNSGFLLGFFWLWLAMASMLFRKS